MTDHDPVATPFTIRTHEPGDIGWIIARHGALYAKEYAWDSSFEALVARVGAQFLENYDPLTERCLISEVDGQPVGSAMVVRAEDNSAKLRLVLVEPSARGLGIGEALVHQCIEFAREQSYPRITLWTNDNLVAARRIYIKAGFTLQYEEPHDSFGHRLIGQYWGMDL